MKTDKLVDMLSTNVEPVEPRHPSRALLATVAVATMAALLVMLAALGIRHDLAHAPALLSFGLKAVFAGLILALAVVFLSRAMRPGGERRISLTLLSLPFISIALLAVVTLALSPSSHWRSMLLGDQWLECLLSIPLIAVVPFALLIWLMRQVGAPTHLARAGALVGLTAGSISALGYALHCADDTVPFVALWYGGTIALCTLAGLILGPRLLRW